MTELSLLDSLAYSFDEASRYTDLWVRVRVRVNPICRSIHMNMYKHA